MTTKTLSNLYLWV